MPAIRVLYVVDGDDKASYPYLVDARREAVSRLQAHGERYFTTVVDTENFAPVKWSFYGQHHDTVATIEEVKMND